MPKTRINCPNCRQPVTAEVDQLIDLSVDPSLKQKLLSGGINLIQCPSCNFQGNLSTVFVYHDPNKELLLTFIPTEIGLPRNDQEKMIGGLINQVINRLPQEKRKGYLLRPQTTLTFQGLIERVLEADGITREMIEAQQKKVILIQRLVESPPEELLNLIKENESLIDAEFFMIFKRLTDMSMLGQDQETAQQLSVLQNLLLEHTTYGQELLEKNNEWSSAMRNLQVLGENITREQLLDLVINASSDIQVQAYASMTRPLMDYQFFQILSEKIDKARGDGRSRLVTLRDNLLELTRLIDQEIESRRQNARKILNEILSSKDIAEATQNALPQLDEFFPEVLNSVLQNARSSGDLTRIGQLQQIQKVIEEASAPPPQVALIEELLSTETDAEMQRKLESHESEITAEFLELLAGFNNQLQNGEDKELAQRINTLNRMAVKLSMSRNFKN